LVQNFTQCFDDSCANKAGVAISGLRDALERRVLPMSLRGDATPAAVARYFKAESRSCDLRKPPLGRPIQSDNIGVRRETDVGSNPPIPIEF
jgi:hypothetical protein